MSLTKQSDPCGFTVYMYVSEFPVRNSGTGTFKGMADDGVTEVPQYFVGTAMDGMCVSFLLLLLVAQGDDFVAGVASHLQIFCP